MPKEKTLEELKETGDPLVPEVISREHLEELRVAHQNGQLKGDEFHEDLRNYAIKDLLDHAEALRLDVEFLAARAEHANSWNSNFSSDRDTGRSSNAIVRCAYGGRMLDRTEAPRDESDLAACERMWEKLPEHRKTPDALAAMGLAREASLI